PPAPTSPPAAKPTSPPAAAAPAATAAPTGAANPAATTAAAQPIDNAPFKLGNNSTPEQAYLPTYIAMDAMKKAGYNVVEPVTFKSDVLAIQALATNETQLMTGALPATAGAVDKGLPIKVIATRANNAWSLVANKDITDCKQLDGKSVGIFSEAGVSTAYLKIYLQQNCPDAQPNYLIIADSPLRRQALEAGQLVATPLEPGDATDIVAKNGDKFHVLANFSQTMPDIGRDIITTNTSMLNEHPTIVRAFLKSYLQAIRSIYDNPDSVPQLDTQHLQLGETARGVAKFFTDNKMWCANGGLGDDNIRHSLDVFGKQYTFVPATMTFEQLVDPGPMNAVLGELGKSNATTC
ncbi:MAG TPA: ABC transporter substrate-binding protein, partial [Chloroflexota bacterium]|nr:ABC transporter substrate-binding protein [Chloroflexota bacterium]